MVRLTINEDLEVTVRWGPHEFFLEFPQDVKLFWKSIYGQIETTKVLGPSLHIDGGTSFKKFWLLSSIFNFFFQMTQKQTRLR